jgi:LAO/AO transport system kinase
MMAHHSDPDVYVRSMASRGRQGGLAWATAALVHVLDAAGFPVILVETVGTGQDGTDIAALADTVVVVQSPGLGDGVQAIKAGLLEVADVVVVNKADLPGASDTIRLLRAAFAADQRIDGRVVPVIPASAVDDTGLVDLLAAIDEHGSWLDASGNRALRREKRARTEVLTGLRSAMDAQLQNRPNNSGALQDAVARVVSRQQSPHQAVAALVSMLAGA